MDLITEKMKPPTKSAVKREVKPTTIVPTSSSASKPPPSPAVEEIVIHSPSKPTQTRTAEIGRYQNTNQLISLDRIITYEQMLGAIDSEAHAIAIAKANEANELKEAKAIDLSPEELQQLEIIAEKVRQNLTTDQSLKKIIFQFVWSYFTDLDVSGIFGQPVSLQNTIKIPINFPSVCDRFQLQRTMKSSVTQWI